MSAIVEVPSKTEIRCETVSTVPAVVFCGRAGKSSSMVEVTIGDVHGLVERHELLAAAFAFPPESI